MKLLFKQRFFSWFDTYDIYNEDGSVAYTVKGQLAWGHLLKIFDQHQREVGMVKQKVFAWMPTFELYRGNEYMGSVKREFAIFKPKYNIDFNGWHVEGNLFEWDYTMLDPSGCQVATVSKQLLNWTDTYVIDVANPQDALCALMFVLAIDAEKCSRSD